VGAPWALPLASPLVDEIVCSGLIAYALICNDTGGSNPVFGNVQIVYASCRQVV